MHGKHVTIVDVGRVVRIQNLIRYEANTGFSNAEKPVLKPNRKTGSSGFFHTGTQPYSIHHAQCININKENQCDQLTNGRFGPT